MVVSLIGTGGSADAGQTAAADSAPGLYAPLHAELLGATEAVDIEAAWLGLAADAVEENPFFEPFALLPALDRYADDHVRLTCVWAGPGRERLIGLCPVVAAHGYAHLPLSYWRVWAHPHCFYAAPLLRRGAGPEAARALLRLLCDGDAARSFLRLPRLDAGGPVATAFRQAAAGRVCFENDRYERAVLRSGEEAEAYFASAIRKKKRKELGRLRGRLQEIGGISFRTLTNRPDLAGWTETFLSLEDKGWKGEAGSSLQASAKDAAWFRESIERAFEAGRLDFLRLDCGEKPIAMLVGFGGVESYSVKICHDPAYARFSPGVMIEIEATRARLQDENFRFADSCAAKDHPMINSLWRDRRRIAGLNISGAAARSKALLRFCELLESMREAFPRKENA